MTGGEGKGKAAAAVVGFSGVTDLKCLRLLKPGFRHCLVAVQRPGGWVLVDPLAQGTDVNLLPEQTSSQLVAALERAGYTPLATRALTPPRRLAPLRPHTCVEAVKRVLGRHWPGVLTPWQLHQALMAEEKDEENNLLQEKILDAMEGGR